jgi:NAD(P) transhydrogenase subunit alpha
MSVINEGKVTFPPPPVSVTAAPAKKEAAKALPAKEPKKAGRTAPALGAIGGVLLLVFIGLFSPQEFLGHFTVFVLACVVGYYVVWNVTHSLHTPLMSVTNAVSGIIVVGALLQIGHEINVVTVLSFIGILIATIKVVGGFTVTQRMLKMFSK